MLLAWQKAGILTYCGYITGFPNDTAESILNDLEVIKRKLPIDVLEIFYLTPLPGSEDHQKMFRAGTWMDPDLNKYDLHHITMQHPRMSREEWTYAYRESWRRYYTLEHCERIMRRSAALRGFANTLIALTWFKASLEIENVHPVESGMFRFKHRRDRRPTMPIEPIWSFYPRYWAELAWKTFGWVKLYLQLRRIYVRIKYDRKRYEYSDLAIAPVTDDEVDTHEMFHTGAARAYVDQERRLEQVKRAGIAHAEAALAAAGTPDRHHRLNTEPVVSEAAE